MREKMLCFFRRIFMPFFYLTRFLHGRLPDYNWKAHNSPKVMHPIVYVNLKPESLESTRLRKQIERLVGPDDLSTVTVQWGQSAWISALHILSVYRRISFRTLIFCHPQSLGGRVRGLGAELVLRFTLRRVRFISIVWDFLDPVLGIKVLVRCFGPHKVLFLDATARQVSKFYGNSLQVCAPAGYLHAPEGINEGMFRRFGTRQNVVLFPGRLYPGRQEVLSALLNHPQISNQHLRWGFYDDEEDLLKEMRQCKAVLVTNLLETNLLSCLGGPYPHDSDFHTHLTGKNFQAVSQGACLLAQRTPALDQYFEEGVDYLGFSTSQEAADLVQQFVASPQSSRWHEVAWNGWRKFQNIKASSPAWHVLI